MPQKNVYAELEIRIFKREEKRGYPVELTTKTGQGQQEFPRGYLRPDILEKWVFDATDPIASGQALFKHLLADKVIRDGWQRAWGSSEHRRIRLRIDETAPELHPIRWEVLHYAEPGKTALPLAANATTPFSRYLADTGGSGTPPTDRPLKLLVAIANPDNLEDNKLAKIEVDREKAIIQTALANIPAAELEVEFLEGVVTLKAIGDALRKGCHMFHLVAHGQFDRSEQIATLFLADSDNKVHRTKTGDFVEMLNGLLQKPRLIFLASCESATLSRVDAFRGFAPALVREAGIPAVLAMQELVPMDTAREFARVFYPQLLGHGLADLAANEARAAVRTAGLPGSGIPVLFSRLVDNRLFAHLETGSEASTGPSPVFSVPQPLPPHYIPRPELLVRAIDEVLAVNDGAMRTSAFHGMGGIGKTVLARALCEEPAIQARFSGGILWATLGQTPNLSDKLHTWIDALGGTIVETAPTLEQLRAKLSHLLRERACLLVVDDVWQEAHAQVFRVGGPRCHLLLTTRDKLVADEVAAAVAPVAGMTLNEAVTLLEQWSNGRLRDADLILKNKIASRLGCLPLAITLAGAQLRSQSVSPEAWLTTFEVRKLQKQPPVRGRRPTEPAEAADPHHSLATTFTLSLERIPEDDRRLYNALAIFKEDEAIPRAAITRLWQALDASLTAEDITGLLETFEAQALLQWVDENNVILHDLLRDFMAAELDQAGQLEAHQAILNTYRQTQHGQGWPSAADDGYLYNHLAYHLDRLAGHDAPQATYELKTLFASDAWLHARVPQSNYQYDGYIADLALAWNRAQAEARRQIEAGQAVTALADCVRYALIRTSLNSLSGNYVPALVARALEVELPGWSSERVLSIAARIPDPQDKAAMLTALLGLSHLALNHRQNAQNLALTAAAAISHEHSRAEVLSALAPQLSGELLPQALTAAAAISHEGYRAHILSALAPQLSGELLPQALAVAAAISIEGYRAEVLSALAPQLSGELREKALQEALTAAAISREYSRARVLSALDPQLRFKLLWHAVWEDEDSRAVVLITPAYQQEVLTAAAAISDEDSRAVVLSALAPHLSGELREKALQQALTAAATISDEDSRAVVLSALALQLSGELREKALQQALTAAAAISDEDSRAVVLSALAPQLSGELREKALQQALTAAAAISFEYSRALVLSALALQLSGELREKALQQALTAAAAISFEGFRAHVLSALAPHLSGELLQQALTAAAIPDEGSRAEVLSALAPHLSGELREKALQQALTTAAAISHEDSRAEVLSALAPHLSGELREKALQEALTAAATISFEYSRARVLSALAPQLSGELREKALQQALTAVAAISHEDSRAEVLSALAPHLSGELLPQALTAAAAISHEVLRARVLSALAPQLSGELLQQALTAAAAIPDEGSRAEVLSALAPHLSGELLQQALTAAAAISDERSRAEVLSALAPHLSGELLQQALTAAAIPDEGSRAEVLSALAPHLSGELREKALPQALTAAAAISDEHSRARVLSTLAPQLSGELREKALQQALTVAAAISHEHSRAEVLSALAPHLSGELLPQALTAAAAISHEVLRSRVLSDLAPQLSGELLPQALTAAAAISDERSRARVLSALAPQLSGELREKALQQALTAAAAISDEHSRARVLSALAPQLSGELREKALQQALTAAAAISHEVLRSRVLSDLAPQLTQSPQHMVDYLRPLQNQERRALLHFLATKGLFDTPIAGVSPQVLADIANHIIEICNEWEWL